MDLFDEAEGTAPGNNAHEFTVTEISGAVKRVIEDQFGRVRVRGEIGRVSRPSSGHLYFDLKDDRSVIAAISWKGQASKLSQRPEEGMEVIATGRLTTFPGQSKYQLIVDEIEPAGVGALMALLESRRKALAAEGLFDEQHKKDLPFLPGVIAVVTSPSGAVIRDILHRLRDRFPSHVLIWSVAVQGQDCARQVAEAINGLNAISSGDPVPRPDLIIVARGGGSLEDLWGFNEEIVVRAAAESTIPLISAVGHETDTTLIDFAADRRAPTPTAAAEMAVPVRGDLLSRLIDVQARGARAMKMRTDRPRQQLRDLGRLINRPGVAVEGPRQRYDLWAARLGPALRMLVQRHRQQLQARPMPSATLRRFTAEKLHGLERRSERMEAALHRRADRRLDRLAQFADRLKVAFLRSLASTRKSIVTQNERLADLSGRLDKAYARGATGRRESLVRLERMRQTLGYTETLKRGYAVIHGPDGLVISATEAAKMARMQIEFADGKVDVRTETGSRKPAKPLTPAAGQKSLF